MNSRGKEAAALALHRFGFGASRDSITATAADPRGALLSDLDRPGAGFLAAKLPSSAAAARAVSDFRAEEQAKSKLAQRAKKEAEAGMASASDAAASTPTMSTPPKPSGPPLPQQIFENEAAARYEAAVGADIGFVERLVWFWSNHFCISADKDVAMVGAYEREAIRAHVLGRFADILIAVESHPAMLYYLDNVRSMGADSIAGINGDKGINENLAREILELHALGVRGGYSQADVTSFAKVLTGWTSTDAADPAHGGEFLFNKRLHEPGEQTVLGRFYAQSGVDQGRAVLTDLAHHTATAQHVAQKLARHFVADEPPPPLVAKLAKAFMDSDGNLKAVAKALVTADEAWTPVRTKLKGPSEWIVSMLRLTSASLNAGGPWNIGRVLAVQATLGESLWRPPAPNGWPDTEAAWIDGVPHRLDIANEFAGHLPSSDPAALLESGLGPIASHNTRDTIARGEPHPGSCASCHGAGISAEMTMRFVHAPTRREMLLASGTLFAWAHLPRLAYAEGRDPRFLTIILRGALDGLATVAPVGDPDWAALRGDNALTLEGKTPALKLNDFFALNPAMPNLHRLFKANQAIVVHACATPYRERSHFDGQDLLESGLAKPAPSDSGWLNRALASLASAGRVDPQGSVPANVKGGKAFAVGPVTPLVVRGPAPVLSWSPQRIQPASADTVQRLLDLYRHTDVKLASAIDESIKLAAIEHSGDKAQKPGGPRPAQVRGYFAEAAGTAAKFLAQPDGPRVGALALDGWDTHNNEGIAQGRLSQLLGSLDGALGAIETNMGPAWRETVVILVTEFGRTARINGTDGTDHGTATVALLAGGALKGGRVIADWPGLKTANLYENRDLKPTTDLRAVLKGLLKDHLRADERVLADNVFPGSATVKPMAGLIG